MQYLDVRVPLNRVSNIFDLAMVAIVMAGERGEVEIGKDDCVSMLECERWADERGSPEPRLVRALSVLPRFTTVYTTGQVAEILGVSAENVRRLMDNGTMSGYHVPNGSTGKSNSHRRMTRMALADYLSRNPCAQADAMGVKVGTKRRKKASSVAEEKPSLLD